MPRAKKRQRDEAEESKPVPAPSADSAYEEPMSDDEDDGGDTALARQVFVEGIPYTAVEADIAKFFHGCGDIEVINAPKWQDSGKLRGYAHVTFTSAGAAKKALERDGRYIGDRFINVARARSTNDNSEAAIAVASRPRPKGCSTLFVKGLPYETDEEQVKASFSRFGQVVSVRLVRWQQTGRLKGVGYVQFETGLSCEAAMKAYRDAMVAKGAARGGVSVGTRTVVLDYDTGAPKQSFKTSTGQSFFKTEEAELVKKQIAKVRHAQPGAAGGSGGAAGGKASSSSLSGPPPKKNKRRSSGDSDSE